MSVKSPGCIQRYSVLNMSQISKENQQQVLIFAGQSKELYPHIIYHFKLAL